MKMQLLESQHAPQRRGGGAVMSFVLHAGIIALAVQATAVAAREVPKVVAEHLVMVDVKKADEPPPPEEQAPPPDAVVVPPSALPAKGFQVLTAPVNIPNVLPEIDFSKAVTNEADFSGRGVAGGIAKGVVGGTATTTNAIVEAQTYLITQVEKIAEPLPGNPAPRYPDALRASAIEGDVVMQFVIDSMGRVDPSSQKVISSAHDLFTESVKNILPRLRFKPAEVGGRKVRMLVQQPFMFSIQAP
ncbi:MAG TPA: energy transducer TonB [Gemmatimonadaceae bacterium]|nr:energy transducer TonB [Gemmatimonadaceae bacterium]